MHQLARLARIDHTLSLFSTTDAVDYWVRDVDGDDSNPGTENAAFKTFDPILTKLPHVLQDIITIHVGVHTGDGYAMPVFPTKLYATSLVLIGDGAGVGDGFAEIIATEGAAVGTGSFRVVKTGGGMTPNEHRGRTIELADGQRRHIIDNDADGFNVGLKFDPAPVATDDYRIVTCSVHLKITSAGAAYFHGDSPVLASGKRITQAAPYTEFAGLFLSQFRIVFADGLSAPAINFVGGTVQIHGVEVDPSNIQGAIFGVQGAAGWMGTDSSEGSSASLPRDLGLASTVFSWNGWGLAELGNDGGLLITCAPSDGLQTCWNGHIVAGSIFANGVGGFYRLCGILYGSPFGLPTIGMLEGGTFFSMPTSPTIGVLKLLATDARDVIEIGGAGRVEFDATTDLQADSGNLVRVKDLAVALIGRPAGVGGAGQPTGTSVSGKAVVVTGGGRVAFRNGTPVMVGGGAPTADYTVEGATATATDFTGAGVAITSIITLSSIQRTDDP